jgi:NADH-quinone oxidoreductase subunit H
MIDESVLERLPLIAGEFLREALPYPWNWIVRSLLVIVGILAVFGGLFAALTLAERKLLGRFQNRPGPNRTTIPFTRIRLFGLFQPIADALKILTKEDIVPRSADRLLHFLAPVSLVAFALITFAVIPFGRHIVPVELDAAVLYFFAAGTASELAVFMAGWASRNKYSLLGAMRALAQLISYELPLLLSFVPVIMLAGTLSTTGIVDAQDGWVAGFIPKWHVLTPWGLVGFVVFLIAAFAESNRAPFDLPEAESEIIAGHLTEYSGFKYALFFMAEYLGMCALSAMGVTLFLGGWRAPLPLLEIIPSYAWFAVKLLSVLFLFIWVRATLPRLRMDQLMRLAWKFLVPAGLLNLLAAASWQLTAGWSATALGLGARWALAFAIVVIPLHLLARTMTRHHQPRVYRYA